MPLTARQLSSAEKRRERLVKLCKSYPKVEVEQIGNEKEHLAFKIQRRIFAYYLFDHHGDSRIALCCKSSLSEQHRLVREDPEEFFVPPYVGKKGWIGVRLDSDNVDWNSIEELVLRAYQEIAPKKLAALAAS